MKSKSVKVDCGLTGLEINVPSNAFVATRDNTPALDDPIQVITDALNNPIGMESIGEYIRGAKSALIAFDAPPRTGVPRQLIIPIIVDKLLQAGVLKENIQLVCATGSQRKRTAEELRQNLGDDIFNQFWPNQLTNNDCTQRLVFLGESEMGDYVEYNKLLAESDCVFYLGTVFPLNWGGFSGIGTIIGLGSARSIRSHHSDVIAHQKSWPADPYVSDYMKHKIAINKKIEEATGKKIFYIDAIPNKQGQISEIFAGHCPEILKLEWEKGAELFRVEVSQADVAVIGLPESDVYGSTNNPLLVLTYAAMAFRCWVNKPIIKKGGVVIITASCNGTIDEKLRQTDKEVLDLFQNKFNVLEMRDHVEEYLTREDYIYRYRHCNAYHPIHPFWLLYEDQYLLDHPSKVIVTGNVEPKEIRKIGCVPAKNFDNAWEMAKDIVGEDPRTLVIPHYYTGDRCQMYVK